MGVAPFYPGAARFSERSVGKTINLGSHNLALLNFQFWVHRFGEDDVELVDKMDATVW